MEKEIGIYCYTNKVNGKKYIGQSIDLNRRHCKMDYRLSSMFSHAIEKYGLDNFDYEVLEYCSVDNLDEREVYWISAYQTFPPSLGFGYNLTSGGGHYEVSDETKMKLSECRTGDKNWNFRNGGEKHPLFGKPITEEHKRRISESKKTGEHPTRGKHLSSDWVTNISRGLLGKQNTIGQKNQPNATSKFYGVQRRGNRPSWKVVLKYKNRTYYIGSSRDEETAARLYDAYVIENNLPHPLNFPDNN
jgi:group I intron endonuclease